MIHIDDFLCAGSKEIMHTVMRPFKIRFSISKDEEGGVTYFGINLQQKESTIFMTQENYIYSMEEIKKNPE